jgi:hypothetical protein
MNLIRGRPLLAEVAAFLPEISLIIMHNLVEYKLKKMERSIIQPQISQQ